MITVNVAILCENMSTKIEVFSKDMDGLCTYINNVLAGNRKFIAFRDTMNSVSIFKIDKIESILLTEVVPFEIIEEEKRRR